MSLSIEFGKEIVEAMASAASEGANVELVAETKKGGFQGFLEGLFDGVEPEVKTSLETFYNVAPLDVPDITSLNSPEVINKSLIDLNTKIDTNIAAMKSLLGTLPADASHYDEAREYLKQGISSLENCKSDAQKLQLENQSIAASTSTLSLPERIHNLYSDTNILQVGMAERVETLIKSAAQSA